MAKARIDVDVQLVMKTTTLDGVTLHAGDFIVNFGGDLIGMHRREALEAIKPTSRDARTMIALAEKMDEK